MAERPEPTNLTEWRLAELESDTQANAAGNAEQATAIVRLDGRVDGVERRVDKLEKTKDERIANRTALLVAGVSGLFLLAAAIIGVLGTLHGG